MKLHCNVLFFPPIAYVHSKKERDFCNHADKHIVFCSLIRSFFVFAHFVGVLGFSPNYSLYTSKSL